MTTGVFGHPEKSELWCRECSHMRVSGFKARLWKRKFYCRLINEKSEDRATVAWCIYSVLFYYTTFLCNGAEWLTGC